MKTSIWNPPIELSAADLAILKLCKKQKLWGFLRRHRDKIIDAEVRAALHEMYADRAKGGRPPIAPERLALAMLVQVGFGVADHEVPTLTAVDRRWQMVLDCDGATSPLVSQGTVFSFRERARAHGLMGMLLSKTVDLAREHKDFSHKRLRAIFDSSPLVGAGRVEDTFNLLGRAIAQLVEVAAEERQLNPKQLGRELDVAVLSSSSVKAMLDVDWREPQARSAALRALLQQFERVREWLEKNFLPEELEQPPISEHLQLVERIVEQDTEPDPNDPQASRRLRNGVAHERLVSISDQDMRHGRKSKTKAFSGYKRHVVVDADITGLICAVKVQPANLRESAAAKPLLEAVTKNGFTLSELHVDRGYLPAEQVVATHRAGVRVISKPPTPARSEIFDKSRFRIDFKKKTVTCPAGQVVPLRLGKVIGFKASSCENCDLRPKCTKAPRRQVTIHAEEKWYRRMAAELATQDGRALRRERIPVEHALARVSAIQGNRARFRGLDKNQFDLQRTAVINNCFVLNQLWSKSA